MKMIRKQKTFDAESDESRGVVKIWQNVHFVEVHEIYDTGET